MDLANKELTYKDIATRNGVSIRTVSSIYKEEKERGIIS